MKYRNFINIALDLSRQTLLIIILTPIKLAIQFIAIYQNFKCASDGIAKRGMKRAAGRYIKYLTADFITLIASFSASPVELSSRALTTTSGLHSEPAVSVFSAVSSLRRQRDPHPYRKTGIYGSPLCGAKLPVKRSTA